MLWLGYSEMYLITQYFDGHINQMGAISFILLVKKMYTGNKHSKQMCVHLIKVKTIKR